MEKRISGSMRTRETSWELIEGRLSAPDARSEVIRLAIGLIIEETLEAESRDALGRGYDERIAESFRHEGKDDRPMPSGHPELRLREREQARHRQVRGSGTVSATHRAEPPRATRAGRERPFNHAGAVRQRTVARRRSEKHTVR